MRRWSIRRKLLTQLRARTGTVHSSLERGTPQEGGAGPGRADDFLEFAQAAGGFGVFELTFSTREIRGTSLFSDLVGLRDDAPQLTFEQLLSTVRPRDLEAVTEVLGQAISSGKPCSHEYCSLRVGGDVGVRSEPGKGSSFWVEVKIDAAALNLLDQDPGFDLVLADEPAYRPHAVGLKPVRAATLAGLIDQVLTGRVPEGLARKIVGDTLPTFSQAKILLVEDNPVNQRVAQRLLEKMSARVTPANNGAEALARLAAASFDLVLMDCQMPVMDGFNAARRVRRHGRAPGQAH